MAPNDCLPQVQVVRLRVTDIDSSGVPVVGANHIYVTQSLIKLTFRPVYVDGTEIERRNGAGGICASFRTPDSFKRGEVSLELCTPDPELVSKLTEGQEITATGSTARPKGYGTPAIGQLSGSAVSIEYWTRRVDEGVQPGDYPWAWHVLPRVTNLRLGDKTFEDGPQDTVITGQCYENTNWYNGPLNNWPGSDDRVWQWLPCTNAEIPAAVCGGITLAAS